MGMGMVRRVGRGDVSVEPCEDGGGVDGERIEDGEG